MRNKFVKMVAVLCVCTAGITMVTNTVWAEESQSEATAYDGVKIGAVEIGGMTKDEAEIAVKSYVTDIFNEKVTLSLANDDRKIETTVGDLGFSWINLEVLEDAMNLGRTGNVIKRYKIKKDIENSEVTYDLEFQVDTEKIRQILEEQKVNLENEAVNATLKKTDRGFEISESQVGRTINIEESINKIQQNLNSWDRQTALNIELISEELQPAVSKADLETIKPEPMASFTTSYTSSGSSRSANIEVAVNKINGSVLMPGEKFSCLEHMIPFNKENGYFPAGSYLGGKLVDSYGGGVCQVSTTLYNTVLLAELDIVQRNNHGLTVSYVQLSSDAAIAESSGMDLIFQNNTEYPIYIEGYTNNKKVTFQIYGNDQRPKNRTIEYKNKIVEVLNPPADVVTEDSSLPAGTRKVTQGSHTGYRAELYKYVYVDGTQQSVEKVNSSYYAPSPNYVTVGAGGLAQEQETPAETNPDGTPVEVPANAPVDNPPEEQTVNPEDTVIDSSEQETTQAIPETEPVPETSIAVSPVPQETESVLETTTQMMPETQIIPETIPETTTQIVPETQIIPETIPETTTQVVPETSFINETVG